MKEKAKKERDKALKDEIDNYNNAKTSVESNLERAKGDDKEKLKEVAELVENNAASAQENTAISQSLNECAQNLKNMADSFRLK